MAVPSNPKLSDIQTEFGGSNPIELTEYYSGGPLVPAGSPAPNGPIPSSGQIAMGQFRGAVNAAFVTATGGTITTSGDYKIHAFTGPGTFSVSDAGNPAGSTTVEYLIVAGGGSGGGDRGGGGGAGGFRDNYPSPATGGQPVSVTSYPISIGSGGAGVRESGGNNGSTSSAFGLTSAGGGGGAHIDGNASSGGSGGGGTRTRPGGTGNSPPVSPSQGRPGGNTSCTR